MLTDMACGLQLTRRSAQDPRCYLLSTRSDLSRSRALGRSFRGSAAPATLCRRRGCFRIGHDPLGDLSVLATEMMPLADALACDLRRAGRRTNGFPIAFAVKAQDGHDAEGCQFRLRGRTFDLRADPVGDADFERSVCR